MNEEDKKKFVDMLQKNIARSCQVTCKSLINYECFETCYHKYLKTIETINETIKQEAYKKHSMIAYKAYPEHQIQIQHYLNPEIFPTWENYGFARKWNSSV